MRFLVWFVLVIAIIESFFAELLTKVILPIEILSSNYVFWTYAKIHEDLILKKEFSNVIS